MSFDWSEFLKLADELLKNPNSPGPKEASLRSATSRAYYAAFCCARNFARDNENFTPYNNAQDHREIRNHFRQRGGRVRRKIATDLNRLRDNRNKADYNDVVRRPSDLAQASVTIAQSVLSALNTL
jgi:uncharacterized protein (UPF0332 family)